MGVECDRADSFAQRCIYLEFDNPRSQSFLYQLTGTRFVTPAMRSGLKQAFAILRHDSYVKPPSTRSGIARRWAPPPMIFSAGAKGHRGRPAPRLNRVCTAPLRRSRSGQLTPDQLRRCAQQTHHARMLSGEHPAQPRATSARIRSRPTSLRPRALEYGLIDSDLDSQENSKAPVAPARPDGLPTLPFPPFPFHLPTSSTMPNRHPSVPYRLAGSQYELWSNIYTGLGVERFSFSAGSQTDGIALTAWWPRMLYWIPIDSRQADLLYINSRVVRSPPVWRSSTPSVR